NTGAGYVIRRILRRAVRYAYTYLKLDQPVIFKLVPALVQIMGTAYPELESQQQLISKVIKEEEVSFLKTLSNGIQLLDQLMNEAKQNDKKEIKGESAFKLYDTYGFPFDLTRLILNENGFSVDKKTFQEELQKQKSRSRDASIIDTEDWIEVNNIEDTQFVGYDELSTNVKITKYRKVRSKGNVLYQLILDKTPFYSEGGGQIGDAGYLESKNEKIQIIDTKKENNLLLHITKKLPRDISSTFNAVVYTEKRLATANNHTATHLMHHALRQILGSHVEQKGSFVHPDYLRFDFSHFQKLSEEEIRKVEQLVNKKIRDNIRLEENRNIPLEEAKKHGAVAFFGEKYGESVRTVKFGDSYELCGGTHVQATGQIGLFKIMSESSVAAGIRRIEAITGVQAEKYLYDLEDKMKCLNDLLKKPKDLIRSINDLLKENNNLHKQAEAFEREKIKHVKNDLLQKMQSVNGINLIVENISFDSVNTIKNLAFQLKNEMDDVVLVIGSVINNRPNLAIMIPDKIVENKQINAGTIIREASKEIKGGGGGQPFFATAGGKDPSGVNAALKKAKELILDAIG
ncbi:MAG: alanine--tRNA ligase, partial [Bacteroidota bacterium]